MSQEATRHRGTDPHDRDSVNQTVLKMIHNKKYPLSTEKFNKIQKTKEKHQLVKLTTSPSQHVFPPHRLLDPRTTRLINESCRTMGDHLNLENIRHEMSPKRACEDI